MATQDNKILRGIDGSKILRGIDGSVLLDQGSTGSVVTPILDIDGDLQIQNRIFKDGSNFVSQITDKAQNIPIIVVGTDYAVFTYPSKLYCQTASYNLDDDEITTNHTLYFHIDNNDHSATAAPGVFYQKGNLIIRQKANANNLEIVINSSVVIDYAYTHSNDYFYAIYFDGTNVYLVENGIIKAKAAYTELVAIGTTELFSDNANYFKGYCYSVKRWDADIFGINGKLINDNVGYFGNDFIWYKRYKDDGFKKCYLSSKYLKDAVISSSTNNISSIRNSLNDKVIIPYSTEIKLDNGFKLGSPSGAQYFYPNGADLSDYNIGTNDFFTSAWFNINTNSLEFVQLFRTLLTSTSIIYCYNGYVGIVLRDGIGGVQTYSAPYTPTLNNWFHLAGGRRGDVLWIAVNGIIKILSTGNVVLNIPNNNTEFRLFGKYFSNTNIVNLDDGLFSVGDSIIDPTGYSVGDKVFEPPRRSSLEIGYYQGRDWVKQSIADGSGVFYLNSRFTEGAVIDSITADITSIKDEFGSTCITSSGTNKPKLTPEGILFSNVLQNRIDSNNNTLLSNEEFMFCSLWHMPTDLAGARTIINLHNDDTDYVTISFNTSGQYGIYRDDALVVAPNIYTENKFNHVALIKNGVNLHLFINGVYVLATTQSTATYSGFLDITLGAYRTSVASTFTSCLLDDVFLNFGSTIIDLTGYDVGNKVFTPPMRSSAQLQHIK